MYTKFDVFICLYYKGETYDPTFYFYITLETFLLNFDEESSLLYIKDGGILRIFFLVYTLNLSIKFNGLVQI